MNTLFRFHLLQRGLFFRFWKISFIEANKSLRLPQEKDAFSTSSKRDVIPWKSIPAKKRKKKHLYLKKKKRNAGVVWKSIPAKKSTLYAFRLFEESILLSE